MVGIFAAAFAFRPRQAPDMANDSALLAVAVLLSASVSAATAAAVELLYLRRFRHELQPKEALPDPIALPDPVALPNESVEAPTIVENAAPSASEPKTPVKTPAASPVKEIPPVKEKVPKPVVELRSLPEESVPLELRLEAFVSEEHIMAFDHARVFEDCPNVFAVLDRLHLYLSRFFRNNEWMQVSAEIAHLTTLHRSTEHDDSDSDEDEDLGGRLTPVCHGGLPPSFVNLPSLPHFQKD